MAVEYKIAVENKTTWE